MNQEPLPGASNALTMGILSIVITLLCCGPFGGIFGIIGLSSAKKAERLYLEDQERYTGYENVKTGRILSWIGIALAAIGLLLIILYFGVLAAFVAAAVAEGGY